MQLLLVNAGPQAPTRKDNVRQASRSVESFARLWLHSSTIQRCFILESAPVLDLPSVKDVEPGHWPRRSRLRCHTGHKANIQALGTCSCCIKVEQLLHICSTFRTCLLHVWKDIVWKSWTGCAVSGNRQNHSDCFYVIEAICLQHLKDMPATALCLQLSNNHFRRGGHQGEHVLSLQVDGAVPSLALWC